MTNEIVITEGDFDQLTSYLLSDFSSEQGVAIFAGSARTEAGIRFLVRELIQILPEQMVYQTATGRRLKASVFMQLAQQALNEGLSLIMAHSHPGGFSTFSGIDDKNEKEMMPRLILITEDRTPHGTLVMDARGRIDARFWEPGDTAPEGIDRVCIIGRPLKFLPTTRDKGKTKTVIDLDRYNRQVKMFGIEGQKHIGATSVAIVGAGGTGSVMGIQLAYLGVRDFMIFDDDVVDQSNLNRLVSATPSDVGSYKVDVLAKAILRINPNARVRTERKRFNSAELIEQIKGVHVLFACTDNVSSRAFLNEVSLVYLIPLINVGVGIKAKNGQVDSAGGVIHVVVPGENCLQCLNAINPQLLAAELSDESFHNPGYIFGADVERPAVISLNSLVVSQAVAAFLDLVTGCLGLKESKWVYDMRGGDLGVVHQMKKNCRYCRALKGLGDGYTFFRRKSF